MAIWAESSPAGAREDDFEVIDYPTVAGISLHDGPPQMNKDSPKKEDTVCICADLLIPGKGKPSYSQAVVSQNGIIQWIGSIDRIPSKYSQASRQHVPVLMPGLWECHAHFMGASPNKPINMENMTMTSPAEAGARAVRQLYDTLMAGFTSCVDLGGYAPELQRVIAEGSILGPTLYGAGGAISMTAGHGDVFEEPLGSVWQKLSVSQATGTDRGSSGIIIADGVDECRKAVRINLRRGAKVIKVLTSGGTTSRDDNPLYQQFSDEELKVIVSEAGRMGLVCAAHAIGKEGIMGAIRAGFKAIEHGSYSDDEVFKAMKEKDMVYVGTITPLRSILDHKDDYPPEMYKKTLNISKHHFAAYRNAIKTGVTIALGSDLFGGPGTVLAAGLNGNEIVYAVDAGMTPLQAIEAATANGPLTLGPQAPKSGQIREGFDADFIALRQNPLDDMSIFKNPKNVTHIWKGGKLVKG